MLRLLSLRNKRVKNPKKVVTPDKERGPHPNTEIFSKERECCVCCRQDKSRLNTVRFGLDGKNRLITKERAEN